MSLEVTRARRPIVGACLVGLAVAALILTSDSQPAQGHCSGGALDIREPGNDKFYNFDFNSQNVDGCNVDWPINFVFTNDATVDRVKQRMEPVGYDNEGGGMWGRLNNGNPSNWEWNFDKGRKNYTLPDCLVGDIEHFRVYAADGNRMFNMNWGFYVVATSHIDHDECSGGWSGLSETAEARIADDARNASGLGSVNEDDISMNNHVSFHIALDEHRVENGGMATRVRVP